MKKILTLLRSMRFGILLLILIAALSVLGSVIPQGRELSWYVEAYPNAHPVLLLLSFHKVFQSWYFILLLGLLCLNLTLCSVVRVFAIAKSEKTFLSSASSLPNSETPDEAALARLETHLSASGCRRADFGESRVYYKRRIGRYGSFLTHLAILLTLILGAAALYLPRVVDMDCMPGESVLLPSGEGAARFSVASFRVADGSGRLDYTSELTITLPDGRSRSGEISVNHPLRFGPYKVYQQSYGTAGSITVTNLENGGSDTFLMTELSFLSLDNLSGLWYVALYPDYVLNAEGQIMPVDTGDNSYPRPVYYVQTVDGEDKAMRLLVPGDAVEIGQLRFLINEPVSYPGLRIKTTPSLVNTLLIVCFALMIAGLFILFFLPPVLVKVDRTGYVVGGPKPEGVRIELDRLLNEQEKEPMP